MPNITYINIDEDLIAELPWHYRLLLQRNNIVISRPIREKPMEYDGEIKEINSTTIDAFYEECIIHDRVIDGYSLRKIITFFYAEMERRYNDGYEDGRENPIEDGDLDGTDVQIVAPRDLNTITATETHYHAGATAPQVNDIQPARNTDARRYETFTLNENAHVGINTLITNLNIGRAGETTAQPIQVPPQEPPADDYPF
jgi:hypothetical protein